MPVSITRWYQADIERAIHHADAGNLRLAAQLYRAMRRDGVIHGLLSTRTGGLVRLPRRFSGPAVAVAELEGADGQPGIFDELFPPAELALLAADGIVLGIGVGEFVEVEGRAHPEFRRLDPEYLVYMWAEDRWYYQSLEEGLIPITPGDGRWVLHMPGGKLQPWNHGLWVCLGEAYISKAHAKNYRENYSAKLANPARAAVSPQGATEAEKQSFFRRVMAWGINTVFGLTPGWDVKLLELKGEGYQVFDKGIENADRNIMIALVGSTVMVDGGTGFANAGIHATVRGDLITETGDGLAHTVNQQGLLPWANWRFGAAVARAGVRVAWDTTPPADLEKGAKVLQAAAQAIDALDASLAKHGMQLDAREINTRFGIPVLKDRNGDGLPDTPTLRPVRISARPPAPELQEAA